MDSNKVYIAIIGLHQTLETDFHYCIGEWHRKPTKEDMVRHYLDTFEVSYEDYDYYMENLWTTFVVLDIRKNV